jgi:hypothetical protein
MAAKAEKQRERHLEGVKRDSSIEPSDKLVLGLRNAANTATASAPQRS